MKERINKRELPPITIVDMGEEIRNGNNTALVNGKVNMVEASVQENGSAGQQ